LQYCQHIGVISGFLNFSIRGCIRVGPCKYGKDGETRLKTAKHSERRRKTPKEIIFSKI